LNIRGFQELLYQDWSTNARGLNASDGTGAQMKLAALIRAGLDSLSEPTPTRFLVLRALDSVFNFLSYEAKLRVRSVTRSQYGFGLLQAGRLAARLGIPRISAIEFGVAGGNGLLALEDHAHRVTRETGVEIEIYGFDSGAGLPAPDDFRDMPYAWEQGFYQMDVEKLRNRLRSANLILGDVRETVQGFGDTHPAPIGFIAFDLDYYSSTRAALRVLESPFEILLPRVFCYFDDVAGGPSYCYNEFTGELLAIHEFNHSHADRKLAQIAGLRHNFRSLPVLWHEQIYVAHLFEHPHYNTPAHTGDQRLALQ
jgi:hypothetical protein